MPQHKFYQIDVFTDQAFGGNPLAVFPDAEGLDTATMQRIAKEMNLSETTFVWPSTVPGVDFKVKIFTPANELPFAGHPVVGTHWLLANIGRVKPKEPTITVKFELGVGIRAATLHVQDGKVVKVVMDQQKPQFVSTADPAQVTRLEKALGLAEGAVSTTGYPVQVVSTGLRQLFVPVRSLAEVQSISTNKQDVPELSRLCEALDPETRCSGVNIMTLALQTVSPWANVHTRLFGPGQGVPEDPATGSASGGLGAYLVENRIFPATTPTTLIISEQGLEMDRPSRIEIEVDGEPGDISMVRVGGQVTPLIEGTLSW